ncbi:MAG: AAA family ATPase [Actinomycetota bacterium]
MFLRQLSIRGFKSFADKTVLEFTPGVSVIVGPNGSGKSNLVDAISWVLGQQGPRAMRSGEMADVIFAGSPSRTALGMAEVKIVIDNSAGTIPVPMSEIEVSRTIFRSGESEYRIGGQVVRLMDVQELLSETGIGRALHTVVGQGQLEDVLTARPEDRRRYIEEAAGIAKHRKRKERAERKLAGLDQDLLRLQDVLAELKRQLKPLRQQAEMAGRHETLTAQADELTVKLAAARLRDLRGERDRRSSGWDEGLEKRKAARAQLDDLDEQVVAAAEERAQATWALQAAETSFRDSQGLRSTAEQAFRSAVEQESAARTALASEATKTARIAAVDEELGRVEDELRTLTEQLAQSEAELDAAEQTFRSAEARRREAEDERRRLSEEGAARRAEIEAIQRSLAGYDHERERLETSIETVRERIAEADAERATLDAQVERLDSEASPVGEQRLALEAERRVLVDEVAELEDIERRNRSRRDLLEARRRDIEETPGSRFLAQHKGRAIGLLRDLVRADPGLERALLAALGPLADAVVYHDGENALADAPDGDGAILAVAAGGPVSFKLPGERSLLSAVTAQPPARGLVSTVLRDVYLATSVPQAADKHAQHPKASFVTEDGVLVGPAVIHTAAGADDRAREIRAELQVLEHDLAAGEAKLRPKHARLQEIARETEELGRRLESADAELTTAAERSGGLAAVLASLRKEEEMLLQRLSGLQEAADAWRRSLADSPATAAVLPELPAMPESPIKARVTVETLRRDRFAHDNRSATLRTERVALAAHDPDALRQELAAAEAARAEAESGLQTSEAAQTVASAERDAAALRERGAVDEEARINKAWREASSELEHLRESYEEEDRIRGDLERRIRETERLIVEGHGADPDVVIATIAPEDSVEALEKRAQLVQRRLALLGRVNLLASGEFEALQQRHDFLQRELEDVRKARRDLLQVIDQIEQEILTTFDAAYRDVAVEFENLIGELFPGGEGRLVLTDPANPLSSGIEIEARPGRKRVKRISLLSGGERALTAMAFLFSIFRSRPSPFYLMDEVEPALDDVNLHRFLRLLEWFAERSQVMIVTHQKRTMEIASTMYGVSMSSDGTSRVLCQRLEDRDTAKAAAEQAHTRAASAELPTGGPDAGVPDGSPSSPPPSGHVSVDGHPDQVTVVDDGLEVAVPHPDPVR